jgi:flagellar motility protein MotE (MotC chaperone)
MGQVSKMKTALLVTLLTFSPAMTFAANAPAKKAEAPAAGPVKRLYTEEEFQKAAMAEAEKMMKKAGSGHLVDFSKELLQKEETLKVRELNLQKQEEQLKINSAEFKKKLVEFEDSQKKFLGCIDSQNEKQQKRISQMVEVISGMKPQNAADVLAVQDPDLSVRILGQLEAQKASKIFNLMDKEVSAKLQRQFLQMKK